MLSHTFQSRIVIAPSRGRTFAARRKLKVPTDTIAGEFNSRRGQQGNWRRLRAFNRLRLGRTTKQRAHLATQEFIQCLHVQLHVELLVNAGDVGADGIDADVAETFWCADSSPGGVRRVLCDGPSPTPARAAEQN